MYRKRKKHTVKYACELLAGIKKAPCVCMVLVSYM